QLLQQENKAQVFWDVDKFYLTDEDQEAGVFIRKHFSKLNTTKEPKWIENSLQEQEKLFYEIECSGNILQTKAFNNFFNQETISASEDTVIVLADEKLLLPLLSSLPEKLSGVNVTMGFPLKDAPLSSFILKYIRLFYHIKSDVESHNFYYKEFFELLKEPFISDFLEKKYNLTVNDVEQIFIKNRIIYFKITDLANLIASEKQIIATEFYDLFRFKELTLHQLLEKLKQLIRLKRELLNEELVIDKIELEILFEWNKLLVQLQNTLKTNQYISSVKSLLYVLNQMLPGYKIDFYGEPLSGIQIMGMLETRNLDFENVLMLSVNEGVLPKGKPVQTFIPFEVKKHFDLPTVYEKDAIFAYHFYRLLQYPETIALFYNNEKDELGSNQEKSRFIHQILNDLPKFKHHKLIYNAADKTLNEISKKVKITPEIREQIIAYLTSDKGVSPTALNTFLDCPLDFYFKYILKIKEQDTLEENIEASTMGTIIHNALKELYQNKIGHTLTANDIEVFEKRVPEIVQQLFKNEFKNENYYRFGQNKIIYEFTHKIIYNFLEEEKKQLQSTEIKILGLEENISSSIELKIKGEKISIKLNGQIDRIDEINGQLRIVDYKTGKDKNDKKYVFQLKIYTLLYFLVNGRLPNNSGLLFLINKEPKFKSILKKKEEINQDFIEAVKEEIEEIIDKMLNAEYFSHNEKATYCILCEK
ncbi:MAG TPA: hypothetical protein DIU39_03905, partial [Flavobacteriales bacterium]|nr:hypothetical protein [Flavobacteriales bacterium]